MKEEKHETKNFDFWKWTAPDFITASPLKEYIYTIKPCVIGKPILEMHIMGVIFSEWEDDDFSECEAHGYIMLDEPIVLICGDTHLEICFNNTSHAKVGINTLSMAEKSYQGAPWREVGFLFPEIIGQNISEIKLTSFTEGFYDSVFCGDGNRPDGGDYFGSLILILENGFAFLFEGQNEYMFASRCSKEKVERLCTF